MNLRKMKFISYKHFVFIICGILMQILQISHEEKLKSDVFGYYVQQPSPRHTSIEHYVDQSTTAFVYDVDYA